MPTKSTYKEFEKRIAELEQQVDQYQNEAIKYQALFRSFPHGITVSDANGNILESNKAAELLLGVSKDDQEKRRIDGKEWRIIRPDGSEMPSEEWASVIALKENRLVSNCEMGIEKNNDKTIWLNVTAASLPLKSKRVVVTYSDITGRKQAEEDLLKERTLLKTIIDNIPVMLTRYNPDANVLYLNKEFEKKVGWTTEEVQDIDMMEKVYPDPEYRQQAMEYMQKASTEWREFKVMSKSGETIDSEWSNIRMEDGTQIGIGLDITDRKQAENDVRASENLLKEAQRIAHIGHWELDPSIGTPVWSDEIFRIFGLNPNESEPSFTKHETFIHPDDWPILERAVEKGSMDGSPFDLIFRIVRPDGEIGWMHAIGTTLISNVGKVIKLFGTAQDITVLKKAEIEKKKLEFRLQQSQKMESIGTLAGGIAHDFNNIMAIILGNTELALDDVPKWNSAHSSLEEIKTASLRAKNIVKQLLSFSRKTDQKMQPIQIASVIKETLQFLRSTIPTTINIHRDIQTTDETVLADPTQINQIIMNLCINASHAMEQTGGDLTVTVEKVFLDHQLFKDYPDLKSGDHVKIMVSDTGPGIDPEIIDQIFDPYFTTKEVGKGSGMGLAVVHGIVKNHNGAIAVDRSQGKGTKFTILFPLSTGKPMGEAQTTQDIPKGSENILFVDDELSIVKMVQRMFERLGYKVETATTPQDALELFRSNPDHFDLVITDMTMPQMTGVKLSEKLMDIRKDIPIIICTGHSALVDEEKAKELGLAAYIMKPINMQETAQTIRKVLDKT